MSMELYEYEIKLLGNQQSLTNMFKRLQHKKDHIKPKTYNFTTIYYDDANKTLQKQGYSLRYRDKGREHPPVLEIKEIAGDTDGVSKRIEIGEKRSDGNMLSLYFLLKANPLVPKDIVIPSYDKLEEIYRIDTMREEYTTVVNVRNKLVTLEAALDDCLYIQDHKIIHSDNELEFEIKDMSGNILPVEVLNYIKDHIENDDCVQLTTESKASRFHKKCMELNS